MALDDAVEQLSSDKEERNKWIGVYIGLLAVLLAICGVGGGNATKDSTRANIEASNTWAFFQAKNMRRTAIQLAANELELSLAAQAVLSADVRKQFEDKIKDYRTQVQLLTTDPVRKEGLDELFAKAKALEVERDVALRKDPYFDWSQALLQIGIVLASVHLIIGNITLLGLSGALSLLGVFLMLNGFTLAASLPFLG
ncbi:MAG TPA: DUF4337 domain-containing protein [Hyphomicrobiaceae bacterium]|jgi:hypothetical protein|nr:DUF4337 domain-containing protein [Hyphomicrobiaceae bacterium]